MWLFLLLFCFSLDFLEPIDEADIENFDLLSVVCPSKRKDEENSADQYKKQRVV